MAVSLVFAWWILRSAIPSHIDNPTLTLHHITKCCTASEVGFEPEPELSAPPTSAGPCNLKSGQSIQQCSGLFQVGGIKPLSEPVVDWLQQVAGVARLSLLNPHTGEVGGCS